MAQGQIGSGLLQVGISGVEPKQTSGLAQDIGNLFGSVAKGVDTYNTIGATAAKLQYQEDALEYNRYTSDIKASLAFATTPEEYTQARQEVDILSAEFVAKANKFKDHKEAYDTYKNYSLQTTSTVASEFGQIEANGVEKTMIVQNNNSIDENLASSGKNIAPGQIDVSLTMEKAILGNSFLAQGKISIGHIQAVNKDIIGMTDEYIASKVADGDVASGFKMNQEKRVKFLNELFGKNDVVKYTLDEDNNVIVSSGSFDSPEVIERYAKQADAFDSSLAKLNSGLKTEGDGAYTVLKQNTKPINIGGTLSDVANSISISNTALTNYNNTRSKQTPEQNAMVASGVSDNINASRKLSSMLETYKVGGDLSSLKYSESQAIWNPITKQTDIQDTGQILSISLEDANKFRDARVSELVDKFKKGEPVSPLSMQFVVRNNGITTVANGFKNSLIAGVPMMSSIDSAKAFKSNIDVISTELGDSKPIIESLSAEINSIIATAEKHPSDKTIQSDALRKINKEVASMGRTLSSHNSTTNQFKAKVIKSLEDNSVWSWDRDTLPETVDAAYAVLYDKYQKTPSQNDIVRYVQENGVNINSSIISWIQDDTTVLVPSYKAEKKTKKTVNGKVVEKVEYVDAKLTNTQFTDTLNWILSTPEYSELKDVTVSNSPSSGAAITIFANGSPHPIGVFDGTNLYNIYARNYKKSNFKRSKPVSKKQKEEINFKSWNLGQ